MPALVTQGTDPRAYLGRDEHGWEIYSAVAHDGQAPTQLVRVYRAPGGLDAAEASALLDRLDHAPDADDRDRHPATAALARYVVNPFTKKHQFPGLWTAGPVEYGFDERRHPDQNVIRQTLTRTWCAGHGYTLDANGRYVYSESEGSTEYATVRAALAEHRSVLKRMFNSRMAFRTDLPGSYRTEIRWRDFTHESIPLIECAAGREAVYAAARDIYGDTVGAMQEAHCETDEATNTVVVVAAAIARNEEEPDDPDDLLGCPCVESPCERETLRALGAGALEGGEGYRYTHSWKFYNLKNTPSVRHLLEFGIHDKDVLPTLLASDFAADRPQLVAGAADAENGRYRFPDGRPWWRILSQKIAADEEEGYLTFTIVAVRADWFGSVAKTSHVAAVENPDGAGRAERTVAESLSHEAAAAAAASAAASEGFVLSSVERRDNGDGSEDVLLRQLRAWSWRGGDAPDGAAALDGVAATSARRTTTATKDGWDVRFDRVRREAAPALLSSVAAALTGGGARGRATTREVANAEDGTVSVSLHVEGVSVVEFSEFLRGGDYFESVAETLRYNVAEAALTPGGFDEATGDTVTSERSLNEDGSWNERVLRAAASPERRVEFTVKGGAHARPVAHCVFRNARTLPAALRDGRHGGSAARNAHGLLDGEWHETDDGDASAAGFAETALSRTETAEALGIAAAAPARGAVVRSTTTTLPDGARRVQNSVETPKPLEVRFTTQEGSGHFVHDVQHVVFRNAAALPDVSGADVTSGSAAPNEFGLLDGHVQGRDNDDIDETRRVVADNAFERSVTDSGPESAVPYSEAAHARGKTMRTERVVYPDGKAVVSMTSETAKEKSFTYTFPVHRGRESGTATVKVFRNAAQVPEPAADRASHIAVSASMNAFGLFDGSISTTPDWDADDSGAGQQSGGSFTTSYTLAVEQSRHVRDDSGNMVDQTRTVTVRHSILAGNISLQEAAAHISGGTGESSIRGPMPVRSDMGVKRSGYIADRVTIDDATDWK